MVQFKVGDTVTLCASVFASCGIQFQKYFIGDINISPAPCTINTNPPTCLSPSGVSLEFQWVNSRASTETSSCSDTVKLKILGSAITDTQGVASITYVITQQDLTLFQSNPIFDLRVCIRNKTPGEVVVFGAVRNGFSSHNGDFITITTDLCVGKTCPDICVGNDLHSQMCNPSTGQCTVGTIKQANSIQCIATHFIDVLIKPHSFFTPTSAANFLITKLIDLDGAISNVLANVIGWQYLGVNIISGVDKVIVRIFLKDLTILPIPPSAIPSIDISPPRIVSMAAILVIVEKFVTIAAVILLIGIAVGVIYAIQFVKNTLERLAGETFTKEQVGGLLNNVLTKNIDNCTTNNPNDPVARANCIKSGIQSTTTAGGDFFSDPAITSSGTTAATNIDQCTVQYNIDRDIAKFNACVTTANNNVIGTITQQTKTPPGPSLTALLAVAVLGLLGLTFLGGRKPAAAIQPVVIEKR